MIKSRRAPLVFLHLTGPYRNVGDSLIRREAMDFARTLGPVVVRVADGVDRDWRESVGCLPEDRVLASTRGWLAAAVRAPRGSVLIREPGEFNLNRPFFAKELLFTLLTLVFKLKSGSVVMLPRGLARSSSFGLVLHRIATHLADVAMWRDPDSLERVGRGHLVPDIAFAGVTERQPEGRGNVAISIRCDRPLPSEDWFEGIRTWASNRDLRIVAVVQVEEDGPRMDKVSQRLGADLLAWPPSRSSLAQEALVRELYRHSAIVISDRLHALILGLVEGAGAVEMVPDPVGKISRHFATVGSTSVSVNSGGLSAEAVINALEAALACSESELRLAAVARRTLIERLQSVLGG